MAIRNVRLLVKTKEDKLIDIACRKIRHKTPEEEERFTSRREKAKRYLGELKIIESYLEENDFMVQVASDDFVKILKEKAVLETLYEGEFVKLYLREDTLNLILILSSVSLIEIFQ